MDKVVSVGKDGYETGSASDILCKVALDLFASQNFSTVAIMILQTHNGSERLVDLLLTSRNKEGLS